MHEMTDSTPALNAVPVESPQLGIGAIAAVFTLTIFLSSAFLFLSSRDSRN